MIEIKITKKENFEIYVCDFCGTIYSSENEFVPSYNIQSFRKEKYIQLPSTKEIETLSLHFQINVCENCFKKLKSSISKIRS